MTNTEKGQKSEAKVAAWLKRFGYAVSQTPYGCPFDLLVNGWQCEVKHATPSEEGKWKFNIHRHGELNESFVDFYIFSLDGVPFSKQSVYVLKKAPMGVKTIEMSFRTLMMEHAEGLDTPTMLQNPKPNAPLKFAGPNGLAVRMFGWQPTAVLPGEDAELPSDPDYTVCKSADSPEL